MEVPRRGSESNPSLQRYEYRIDKIINLGGYVDRDAFFKRSECPLRRMVHICIVQRCERINSRVILAFPLEALQFFLYLMVPDRSVVGTKIKTKANRSGGTGVVLKE